MLAALLFTVSAVGAALAPTFTWFVIYRIIGGLAVGIAATVSPMYMSEVSPATCAGARSVCSSSPSCSVRS